jgi:hypothetical protein
LFLSHADVVPASPLAESLPMTRPTLTQQHRSLHHSFLFPADVFPAAPLAASLVSFPCQRSARCAARCVARFFLLSTFFPPRRSTRRSFLSVADVLPAAALAVSLVSFSCQGFARRAVRCIARFFFSSTSCPPHRSLFGSFLPLVDVFVAARLAASLVSFSC